MVNFDKFKELFKKKESESDKPPEDTLPDTAKDVFGDAPDPKPKPEPPADSSQKTSAQDAPPEELPNFDFKKEDEPRQAPAKEEHRIIPEEKKEIPVMESDLAAFEDAFSQVYSEQKQHEPEDSSSASVAAASGDAGFFSEFRKFLEGNDVPEIAGDILKKDLLSKMKDFYTHKQEGKPYYFHSGELKKGLKDRMSELQSLESEWLVHKEKLAREEELLFKKEQEISDKLEELRYILRQIRQRDELFKEAPGKRYFYLSNGQVLKSIADLRTCLRVLDDSVFKKHVIEGRNDFSEWVLDVFKDKKLADILFNCRSRDEMISVINEAFFL